jgi:hypothetical protein
MESKKINQLATELTPDLSDLTIIGDPTTGVSKKITLSQMASLFTGTVEEYANFAAFPLVGVADTIYIAKDTNVIYRWDSTAYVVLSPNIIASLVFNDANGFDGTISLVGSVATLTITTALTSGSVPFIGASGALTQDNSNLFFDDTNNRLGINTNAPTTALDVFGSGIIGRINGTSTNNAFLGFGSAGTNRWSIGNVQSDHRFRIYNEATTSELVSILSTGEFGIGIANPTTKLHIDGGASALIANLDANVSVAKSISFRSDNSNRFNIEVSGTESGSNAGANFFIRRYSDAGSLIDTPLTITRSTGAISLATALSGTTASFTGLIRTDLGTTGNSGIFTGTNSNLQINHDGTTAVNLINTGGGGYIFKASDSTSTLFSLSNAGIATFNSSSVSHLVLNGGTTVATRLLVARGSDDTNQNLLLGWSSITTQRLNVPLSSPMTDFSIIQQGSNGSRTPFYIKSDGNVGISMTDPQSKLHIISALGANVISIGESGTNTRFAIGQESGYTGNYINSQNIDLKLLSNLSGGSGGNIRFYTGSSGVNNERFIITSGGAMQVKDGSLTGAGGFEFTSEAFFGARFQSNAYKFMGGNNSTEYMRIASTGNITTEALFSPTRQSNKNYTGSYGVIVVGSGNVSSYTFNLQTVFPEMAISGNVVAVYGKYAIYRGAQAESGQFGISRNTSNTWTSGAFSNQTATGAYSLSSVTGSVNSLTFTFNTNIYFVCEITCMIS